MNRNEVRNALMQRFLSAIQPFILTWKKTAEDFRLTLAMLDSNFGANVVDAELGRYGISREQVANLGTVAKKEIVWPGALERKLAAMTTARPPRMPAKSSAAKSPATRIGKLNKVSFTDLKPIVARALQGYGKGVTFTVREASKTLDLEFSRRVDRKTFDMAHLSLILAQYLKGIKLIGKIKGPHVPMNQYQVVGKIRLTQPTKLKTSKPGKTSYKA